MHAGLTPFLLPESDERLSEILSAVMMHRTACYRINHYPAFHGINTVDTLSRYAHAVPHMTTRSPRIWVVNKIHTAVLNHTSRVCTERSDAQAHGHRCIPPRRITHHIRVSKARFCIRQELKSRRAKNRVLPCGVHDGFLCSEDAELLSQCAKKNESRTRTQIQRCGRQDVGEACCCAAQRH